MCYPTAPRPRYCRFPIRDRITKASISALPDRDGKPRTGYQVKWRYVTIGARQWVMVQDSEISEADRGYGFWYFIPRYALGKEALCPRATGIVAGNFNCVNETEPASQLGPPRRQKPRFPRRCPPHY